MALIKCPECGKQVSSRAEVCIHCGYPLQKYAGGQDGYSGYGYQDDFSHYPGPGQGGYGRYPNQQGNYSRQEGTRSNTPASYAAVRNIRPSGQYRTDDYETGGSPSRKNWRLRVILGIAVALLCAGIAIVLLVLGNQQPGNNDPLPTVTVPLNTEQAARPAQPTVPPSQNQNQNPNQEKYTQPPAPTEPAGSNQEGFTHPPAPTQPTSETQEIPLFNYTDNG